MTTATCGSGAQDHPNIADWESELGTTYADDEAHVLEITEAFNAGSFTYNNANTEENRITTPAGSAFRFSEQSSWRQDMGAALTDGAYFPGCICSGDNDLIVEFCGISASVTCSTSTARTLTFRACLFGRQLVHSSAAGSVVNIYSCAAPAVSFWGTEDQFVNQNSSGTINLENNLSIGHDGFEYRIQSGTCNANNNVGFEIPSVSYAAVFSGAYAGGSDDNVSGPADTSAPGSGSLHNIDPGAWMNTVGIHNLDASITASRRVDDDAYEQIDFESGDFDAMGAFVSDSASQLDVHANAALASYSTLGARLDITSGGTNAIRTFQFGDRTDATIVLLFRVDSGFSMDDGDELIFARGDTNSGSLAMRFVLRRSGSDYQVRFDSNLSLGTWTTITRGTTYVIRCRRNSVVSGLQLMQIAPQGTNPSYTDVLNHSADYSGASFGQWGIYYTSGNANDSGEIHFDVVSVHSPDVPAAPDSTVSPMGDDATGTHVGSDPTWPFDIEGTARPSGGATIGPFQDPATPAAFPFRRLAFTTHLRR